ncbi:hypothetical protein JCM16358_00570 [Halanaerocella petrolearia]
MNSNKKLTLLLIAVLIISYTTASHATFTTGKGKHTFKVDIFRPTPELRLQSFLAGFGIDKQSSINFRLTNTSDSKEPQPVNFLAPYYKDMKGTDGDNNFYLTGPVLEVMYQYIPAHPLFVTDSSLNAIQVGLRNLRGDSKLNPKSDTMENVNRTYLTFGLLSRSRFEDNNLFSSLNLIADLGHSSWGLDGQVGMEFKLTNNFRTQISYKYKATTSGTGSGVSVGVKAHY